MKLKNIIAILLIVLTLGVLFTGCSKTDDTTDNQMSASDGQNINTQPDDSSAQVNDEVQEAVGDNLDDEVEIGSLI